MCCNMAIYMSSNVLAQFMPTVPYLFCVGELVHASLVRELVYGPLPTRGALKTGPDPGLSFPSHVICLRRSRDLMSPVCGIFTK